MGWFILQLLVFAPFGAVALFGLYAGFASGDTTGLGAAAFFAFLGAFVSMAVTYGVSDYLDSRRARVLAREQEAGRDADARQIGEPSGLSSRLPNSRKSLRSPE